MQSARSQKRLHGSKNGFFLRSQRSYFCSHETGSDLPGHPLMPLLELGASGVRVEGHLLALVGWNMSAREVSCPSGFPTLPREKGLDVVKRYLGSIEPFDKLAVGLLAGMSAVSL